jgi:iron(III) transport system ATP-binding protein
MSSVVISGITKRYGPATVLDAVDLTVPDGSLTAVLGPSGCGKTTLLRIVAGFVRADAGTVTLGERVVESATGAVPPERRRVGYVPQEGALFPHLDIARNILFGLPRAERTPSRLAELLDLAELPSDVARRSPHELSGGQQQRVALARALAPRPSLILLDEPFSSLDAALRVSAGRSVTRVLRHAGATALLVTHDQGEALSLADQVAVMRAGRFVQVDAPSRIYDHPVDVGTAAFVGGASVLPATLRDGRATCALGEVAATGPDGSVSLVLRPEQLKIVSSGGVRARVREVSYFGAHVAVVLVLADGTRLTARGPSTDTPVVGAEVGLDVEGTVLALPGSPA